MQYEIIPLAITKVEWGTFVSICQNALNTSPTRGLDATHLKITDPAAYLACLNMENEPLDSLRRGGLGSSWFEHFSISFSMLLDDVGVCLLTSTPMKVYWKQGKRREYLCIVTGTMGEWYRFIISCDESSEYELRYIMNHVLASFEQAGFREVFSRFSKQHLHDRTFVLKS